MSNTELSTSDFEASLRINGIPPRPAILEFLDAELKKPEPDMRAIDRVISGDVAIAAAMIRTVNSPYFGLFRQVRTIREAILILGLRGVSQVAACVAFRNMFPNVNFDRFWDSSMKVASLSAWLASLKRWGGVRPEDAFTFGLFRDCGIPVLVMKWPGYKDLLKKANQDELRCFTDVEQDSGLPTNHARVGAMLTASWWLPTELVEAVRLHHELKAISGAEPNLPLPEDGKFLIAISQLAERLLQMSTGLSETREWAKLGDACLERLGFTDDMLEGLQRRAADELVGG